MKRRAKAISKPRAIRQPRGVTRVIRISEEAWVAKCAASFQQGGPLEISAYFDRAQWFKQPKVS